MLFKLLNHYKIRVLVALTIVIAIIASRGEKHTLQIILTLAGGLLGMLIPDIEYFVHSYWDNPDSEFSKGFKDLMNQKNFQGLFTYVNAHKHLLSKRVMHSVLFQIILGGITLFLATSQGPAFGTALSLSAFTQTFYLMYQEVSETNSINTWFWILKSTPTRTWQGIYATCMGLFLIAILVAL